MASSGDIRDIMNLGHDGPRQLAPKKKKKHLEAQPRLSGISREVQALMGDSVPPVAIVETPKYKQKPSVTMKMFKPRHWEERTFVHGARKDGLQLRHWKRSIPEAVARTPVLLNNSSTDVEMVDGDNDAPAVTEVRFEDEFPSEKWNVEVPIKKYDGEQYEKYFKSEEWTEDETNYLMQMCQDYDLRWLLIADRYNTADIPLMMNEDDPHPAYPQRKMEELKQRYYSIAAKMLELQTPASNMTQPEFQLWEKMRNFDARTEVQRKAMAEKLFERTKEEADEEKVLLEELYRITKNEDDFIKMRKELYARLETAPSLRRNERGEEPSTALYQTSQGLSMLLSSLLAKEKRFKTRVAPNGQEAVSAAQTPSDPHKSRHGPQFHRRETMDSTVGDDNVSSSKKGSMSQAPVVRTLAPAEEVKFGVSHPQERLTSGVMFRHEKINRLTMAKSQVQTQKIGAALTELGIPPRLLMPTERVCREFERLVSEVQILLDTRRVLEKVSSEVKVLEEQKRLRLGGAPNTEEGADVKVDDPDAMEIDNTAALAEQQNKVGANAAARHEGDAEANKVNSSHVGIAGDDSVTGMQDNEDAEIDDSQAQGDEDDDNDNEVDQSVIADEEEDEEDEDEGEDADEVDQAYAQQDDEDDEVANPDQEEDQGINVEEEEDEDDNDDAPGLEDLERANQVTDDEDEENEDDNEDDNEIDPSQIVEDDDDEEQEEDGDVGEENHAEVDESMMDGADGDEGEEQDEVEDEEDESRPVSSHSNARAHKRSASVLSEASRAGSNRSGAGRKRRK